jgi:RNA 3'-phosphate cyclase
LGSKELWFEPRRIVGGKLDAQIGTAGSIPMLLMTVLPLCAFAGQPVTLHVSRGGTDVRYSPTTNYLKHVLLPVLARMGLESSLEVHKYGYYPKGMGEVTLGIKPAQRLSPLRLEEFGSIIGIKGVSVCTFLADRRVAERQAREAERLLSAQGYRAVIQVVNDFSNPSQKGSSLTLWARTSTSVLLGADSIGEIRKPSETVAREAVKRLVDEIQVQPTVDVYLADMVVPYIALAKGESAYLTRTMTDHLESNLWLASTILGADFGVEKKDQLFRIVKK